MPIYEYRCTSCGNSASELEKIGAARVKKCPACGKRTFSRLVSAAAFHLKGGGWYATDFKDSGKKKPAEKESGKTASDSGDKKESAKSDGGGEAKAKPAADKKAGKKKD